MPFSAWREMRRALSDMRHRSSDSGSFAPPHRKPVWGHEARRATHHAPLLLVALGLALTLASCRDAAKVPTFPHEKHAAAGLGCADCHKAEAGMRPQLAACRECHEAEASDPTFADAALKAILAARPARGEEYGLVFDHARHEGAECSVCHTASGSRMLRPVMATCLDACHGAGKSYPLNCRQCHSTLTADGRPASHTPEWRRRHGAEARPLRGATRGSCLGSCHTEPSCFDCHKREKPANHTQHFRLRGHGVIAQADRERCLTCHTSEYCTTCHLGTKPINHIASWRSTANRHCTNCHLPLSANSCSVCHLQAPHRTAPRWTLRAFHVSGVNCRACHGTGGGPFNHIDNGDNCEICHAG